MNNFIYKQKYGEDYYLHFYCQKKIPISKNSMHTLSATKNSKYFDTPTGKSASIHFLKKN